MASYVPPGPVEVLFPDSPAPTHIVNNDGYLEQAPKDEVKPSLLSPECTEHFKPMSKEINQQWMDALKRTFAVKRKPFPLQDYQKALFDQMGASPKTNPVWPTLTGFMVGNGLKRGELMDLESYIVPKSSIPGKTFSVLQALDQYKKVLHVAFERKPVVLENLAKRYPDLIKGSLNVENFIEIDSYSQIVDSVRYPHNEPYSIDFTRKHFLYRDAVFNTLMNTPLERSMLRMETNPYVKPCRRKNISLQLAIRKLYRH